MSGGEAASKPLPSFSTRHGRSLSQQSQGSASAWGLDSLATSRNASGTLPAPGSFNVDLRSGRLGPYSETPVQTPGLGPSAGDYFGSHILEASELRQAQLRDQIGKEAKIKAGSENLLEALIVKNAKQTREQRQRVESELNLSNRKLEELNELLQQEITKSSDGYVRLASPPEHEDEAESPSLLLDDILQALEMEGMQPDYYIDRANRLVELFKRHGTLKYDLAWSIFGLRVQTMLLSDSREVVAAGYRVTRHAMADRRSLEVIRALHTDVFVVLSLIKDRKASIEREQALKFVRAFIEIKDGIRELSDLVLRTIVAIAEQQEDRLQNLALLTLAELLVHEPIRVLQIRGIGPLAESLMEGSFEGLAATFLRLEDEPATRKYLESGLELDGAFTQFTGMGDVPQDRLKSNARLISSILRTWPGLFAASRNDCALVRSLMLSLKSEHEIARDLVLDLLFDLLHITPPAWAPSFLAGRRLTTYGRVANLQTEETAVREQVLEFDLVEHFIALLLGILLHSQVIEALTSLCKKEANATLCRKGSLLLAEILKLADRILPASISAEWQSLADIFCHAIEDSDASTEASALVYQIDRVGQTMQRSGTASSRTETISKMPSDLDELKFRNILMETQVLSTTNHLNWRWDLINDLILGPFTSPRRMEEAIKFSKFMKRLLGFYRPFKYRFSEIRNTRPNQRYVRTACALLQTLLKTAEGSAYLTESKLLRQLAECLAQLDRQSGLTALKPLFSRQKFAETLTGGYFAMLGALSKDARGLAMLERWRMINMFYHILDLDDRPDLIRALLSNLDYSLDSHLRIILSKGLTACNKDIRIYATGLVQKYAMNAAGSDSAWAIRLLVTQLYDPEVQVSEVAVQILEGVCDQAPQLEYIVKCRPALDHLGAIGAPLLLRFLSTSTGYQYLDDLDYITQEMDDWYLGRNDTYVMLVEASLSLALSQLGPSEGDITQTRRAGVVPAHFYRELSRTSEGCQLLRESGHFEDFVATIEQHGSEDQDHDVMLKVKGCLWAVGNVGAMDLGAPFLIATNVIPSIVKIATSSAVMTMRGTAYFVLGMISRSLHGMEALLASGWDAAIDDLGRSNGNCMPVHLFTLLGLERKSSFSQVERDPSSDLEETDGVVLRIVSLIVDLSNTVLTKRAAGELYQVKSTHASLFQSVNVFRRIMVVLASYPFRLSVRRFVVDLFDKAVLRRLVLEDDV